MRSPGAGAPEISSRIVSASSYAADAYRDLARSRLSRLSSAAEAMPAKAATTRTTEQLIFLKPIAAPNVNAIWDVVRDFIVPRSSAEYKIQSKVVFVRARLY